jgi:hypothetical protein
MEVKMKTLIIFNIIQILIIAALLFVAKKRVHSKRAKYTLLLIAPLITVLFHYSSFIYHSLCIGDGIAYLAETPNLVLPIYPCNVVMWCALLYGLLPNKDSKFALFLSDYVFWFGLISTLVGMFANVDFIMNPTLADFEVTKSIVAHATLLFNLLLIPVFGLLRPDFVRNMRNMTISVLAMYVIGLYCNLVFEVLVSAEKAFDVNSMFLIHSPFEGLPFLRYPVIAALGLLIYFILFTVCDMVRMPRGKRWFNRALTALRKT